jgi:SAM-dependent methyltransferase
MKKDKHYKTIEQVIKHYEIEKELASKLQHSTKEERQNLYTYVYNELYTKLRQNSMEIRNSNPKLSAWVVAQRMQLLDQFLSSDSAFLEMGPGDCSLALEVSKRVKKVYAVDVSKENVKDLNFPQNFEFVISDCSSIPVLENSIDIAYSHQLMEHLHPDDAIDQLQNIYKALVPGGIYICITPNRLSGPHDISHHFDEVSTGLHLKEYTVTELYNLFCTAGFSKVSYYKSYKRNHVKLLLFPMTVLIFKRIEELLNALPYSLRRTIASMPMLFRGMTIVGTK